MFGLVFRGELPSTTEQEFEHLITRLRELWLVEHNEDGTHNIGAGGIYIAGSGESVTDDILENVDGVLYWNGAALVTNSTGVATAGKVTAWGADYTLVDTVITASGSTVTIDGSLDINSGSFSVDATQRVYLDGGTHSYIYEAVSDRVDIVAGGTTVFQATTVTATVPINLSVTGLLTVSNDIDPAVNYASNIGALNTKFLTLHAAELWVETLVAQNTVATIGGRVIIAPTNILTADLAAGGPTITVKYNNFANGDRVYMEADGKVEWMAITSSAGGGAGAYTYSVTRNLDGTGANQWYAGDALVNTGTTGDGFIDLYSVSGVLSGSHVGPTIVGNVRTGTTYSQVATRWAIGNLNGLYGYASDTYGFAAGDSSAANIVIDATNGIRIRHSTTNKITLDAAGNASFSGSITSASGTIGGWTIGASSLTGGNATLAASGNLTLGTGNDVVRLSADDATYRLWVGNAAAASAPFRVAKSGQVSGTNVSFTAGGVTLDANGLYIDPSSASGGGAYDNSKAVRWTTDTTYRTAIWRSDSTTASVFKEWNFDHQFQDSATAITQTNITTRHYDGTGTNYSEGKLTLKSTTGLIDMSWLYAWSHVNTNAALIRLWSGGGVTERQVTVGVGTSVSTLGISGFYYGIAAGLVVDPSTVYCYASGAARLTINSTGLTVTGALTVTGNITPDMYIGRAGAGGAVSNRFNIYWTGSAAQLWIDVTNAGDIALITATGLRVGGGTPQYPIHAEKSIADFEIAGINTNASPKGLMLYYPSAAPNGTGNEFIYCWDNTPALRMAVRSNGGIANYQANDVNLSDVNTKTITGPAPSQRDKIRRIPFVLGRYTDSKRGHDDLMWLAQDVQAIDPTWVEMYDDTAGLLGTRDHAIFQTAVAVVGEHDQLLDNHEARIAALEARIRS